MDIGKLMEEAAACLQREQNVLLERIFPDLEELLLFARVSQWISLELKEPRTWPAIVQILARPPETSLPAWSKAVRLLRPCAQEVSRWAQRTNLSRQHDLRGPQLLRIDLPVSSSCELCEDPQFSQLWMPPLLPKYIWSGLALLGFVSLAWIFSGLAVGCYRVARACLLLRLRAAFP